LATVGEVFSFAKSSKAKANLAIGLFASVISGAIQPGRKLRFTTISLMLFVWTNILFGFLNFKLVAMAFVFADVFTNFADGSDTIGLRRIVYTLVIIGISAFIAMAVQSTCLEMAAAEMTNNMMQEWFEALLRQDMAYYDLMNTSGTATIINGNGKRFQR
jgi:ABC-type multidrug transport system fused ATPase/permease subunit